MPQRVGFMGHGIAVSEAGQAGLYMGSKFMLSFLTSVGVWDEYCRSVEVQYMLRNRPFLSCLALGIISLATLSIVYEYKLSAYEQEIADRLDGRRAEQSAELSALDAKLTAIRSSEEVASGALAATKHQTEWEARKSYDIRYAQGRREKMMARMARLGGSKDLPLAKLVRKIAWMAAPEGAAVQVSEGPTGLLVSVTFDMASMASGESGSSTQHNTIRELKDAVVRITARVVKDLFGSCGWRGIERISVACTHGIEQGIGRSLIPGPVVTELIYQASVSGDTSSNHTAFKRYSEEDVARHFRVDHDEFGNLEIRRSFGRSVQ